MNTGLAGLHSQLFQTVLQEGVQVAHQDDARTEDTGAQLQLFHDPFQTDTVAQHPARGLLHHRAVGHRIGKGDTDLDDVRPALVQFHQSGPEAFFIRETEGHEGDQGMTSGGTGRTDLFFKDMHDELPERPLTTTPVMAVVIWLSAGFSRTTARHEAVFPLSMHAGMYHPSAAPLPVRWPEALFRGWR